VRAIYTNTVPVDAYRGAGRPQACYLVERIMETAAHELGLDPHPRPIPADRFALDDWWDALGGIQAGLMESRMSQAFEVAAAMPWRASLRT
jgi:hypothetical protein